MRRVAERAAQNYLCRVVLRLACYMVVLLECNRRFPRPLHQPSARQAEEVAATRERNHRITHAEDREPAQRPRRARISFNAGYKYDPATRTGSRRSRRRHLRLESMKWSEF